MTHFSLITLWGLGTFLAAAGAVAGSNDWIAPRQPMDEWRAADRIIDLHQHLDYAPDLLVRAANVMEASGIGLGVDLTPGTVTPGPNGEPSEFQSHKAVADKLFPGRWIHYMNLDYRNWDQPDFAQQAVRQVEEGHRLGSAGFKQEKSLGLFLRDGQGKLLRVDDPKLDPMWERLGELNMPVSIHTGDPKAFFEPYNDRNERWKELKDHPRWWFGDTNKYPTFHALLDSITRVIARHPRTTFVCVHFGNNSEELDWVDQTLARHPNMRVDLAARIPELGRHDPQTVHRFFIKYQDRIFFGTDFQSLESKMILGSSGNEPPPTVADAEVFFLKEYRWLETWDRNWAHMTPIQGDWTISSIGLPASMLRKIYFDNARQLLARSLPAPVAKARRTSVDFEPDGDLSKTIWQTAAPVFVETQSADGKIRPELATAVRCLWSDQYLYLSYRCPYTTLTTFKGAPSKPKRAELGTPGASLWDRDVVEAFVGSDPGDPKHYGEFEVAPTNERLDVEVRLPDKDFAWASGFQSAVMNDKADRTWDCEMRIPLSALSTTKPTAGARWRLNLYRGDRANKASLAWHCTLQGTFHAPERFGYLEFVE